MFIPKFTITNEILINIGLIDAAREVVMNAPIVPAWEKKFAEDAVVRTVHYGTAIEGNALTLDQARDVLEGKEITARERDIQEVLNYREVLKYIDRLGSAKQNRVDPEKLGIKLKYGSGAAADAPFEYKEEMLLKIHELTVNNIILPEEGGRVGEYRKTEVIIRSVKSGEASYKAPPAVEVPYLVEAMFVWLNALQSRVLHPVLRAGIVHYLLAGIHPFIEGNGRVARAMAMLVLWAEGYDIRKLFSIEEYFDHDVHGYYSALQAVSNQAKEIEDRDLTPWLEYFTEALGIELNRVKEKVRNLSLDDRLKNKMGKQIALSERQIKMVEYMKDHEELFMRDAQELIPKVSDDTLLRDLKDLIKKGLVKKRGRTKSARYTLNN